MNIVTRSQWGAEASRGPAMKLPASEVWIHHSVSSVSSDPHKDMRAIEDIGVSRFGRFSYSYAIHPDGTVMEGAGTTIGAHTANRNSKSLGIVFIGNYEVQRPTAAALAACRDLLDHLVAKGILRQGTYPTGGHRDTKATACPGKHLYAAIPKLRKPTTTKPPAQPSPTKGFLMSLSPEAQNTVAEQVAQTRWEMALVLEAIQDKDKKSDGSLLYRLRDSMERLEGEVAELRQEQLAPILNRLRSIEARLEEGDEPSKT